jgi:DNA-binding Xre family transcriptional regulator
MTRYKEVIKKLTIELDINELELSKKLGISQQALTERKKKNATKYDDIINLCLNNQIDLNSLFQEDSKQVQQGFSLIHPADANGFVNISEAYNSWKIPNNILQLFNDRTKVFKAYMIENNTMSPLINKYDSVIIDTLGEITSQIKRLYRCKDSDLILCKLNNYHNKIVYCRRIYFIDNNRYILKSDNQNIPDIIDEYEQYDKLNNIEILGIVTSIIKNGA